MRAVKSRPGTLRAERAEATRDRILHAARETFVREGYGATTLREIASAAGVAVQTVYAVFGTKANILRALRDGLVNLPAADAAFRDALSAPDVRSATTAFARSMRLRWENGHDIVAIDREAASVDAALRAELTAVLAIRRRGIAELSAAITALEGRGDPTRLSAAIDALTDAEGYAVLTRLHGWSADDYESWLAPMLDHVVEVNARGGTAG